MEICFAIPDQTTGWAAVRRPDQPDHALAHIWTGNPLKGPPDPEAAPMDGAPWIVWSGSLASDPTIPEPRNWMGPGLAAFTPAANALAALAREHSARLLFRPHARQILSDALLTRRWLEAQDAAEIGLALDPPALLEPPMLDAAEEHLERIFAALGPLCEALLCFGHAGEPLETPLRRTDLASVCARLAMEQVSRAHLAILSPHTPQPVQEAIGGYTRAAKT